MYKHGHYRQDHMGGRACIKFTKKANVSSKIFYGFHVIHLFYTEFINLGLPTKDGPQNRRLRTYLITNILRGIKPLLL